MTGVQTCALPICFPVTIFVVVVLEVGNGVVVVVVVVAVVVTAKIKTLNFLSVNPPAPFALTVNV